MHHTIPRTGLLLILVLLGVSSWRLWFWKAPTPDHQIRASGTIEATEVLISPKIGGRICELYVDEGSIVRAGDPIAQLETNDLQAQTSAAQAALAHATAQWDAAHNGSRPEQIAQARAQWAQAQATVTGAYTALLDAHEDFHKVTELKAQVDAAQTHYDAMVAARTQAQEALRLTREGTRTQQLDQARAAVAQAQVALDHDERDYRRMLALYQQDAISRQQWEAALAARDTARTELDQAKAHQADLDAGARPQEIREAEMAVSQADANVDGARLALQNAQQTFQDRLDARTRYDAAKANYKATQEQERAAKAQLDLLIAGTRAEDLRAAREAVRQAKANLDYARVQYGNARVTAPIAGVIVSKEAELGEVLAAGAPIVTLDDLDHIWLRVYVPEDLYGRVKIGQTVQVTVDSYPKEIFKGTVAEIASDAEFTPKNVQTEEERVKLVYGIKVNIDNRDHRLKPGMPADAVLGTP
jgi:multidrug resistance efflux pump